MGILTKNQPKNFINSLRKKSVLFKIYKKSHLLTPFTFDKIKQGCRDKGCKQGSRRGQKTKIKRAVVRGKRVKKDR